MVSHSTCETELESADYGVRAIGLPSLVVWKVVMGNPERNIVVHEDNAAMIQVMNTGKTQQ